jgi:ABC-type lipoprotein release transport system permease subunit
MNLGILKIRIVPGKRLLLGMVSICLVASLIFCILSSFLFVINYMNDYIGKDTIYIFQDGAWSFRSSQIHMNAISDLKNSPGVELVSPESFVYSYVNNNPVIIRGITTNAIILSDYFELVDGEIISDKEYNTALVGFDTAKKLGLKVNDTFIVPSSRISTFSVFKVKGIFKTYSLMDSEILVPLESVWNIDLNPKRNYFSVARIKVNSSFNSSALARLDTSQPSDISSITSDDLNIVVKGSYEKNISIIERARIFLGYKPSAKQYVQEAVEEAGQAVDRKDYVKEEITKIESDINKSDTQTNNASSELLPEQKTEPKTDIEIPTKNTSSTNTKPAPKTIENIEEKLPELAPANKTDQAPISEADKTKLLKISVKDKSDVLSMLAGQGFKEVVYVFGVVTLIVILTSVFAISSSVANMVFQSRNELSIISKVGAKESQLELMFLFRLLIITFTASIIGAILGFFVILIMSRLSLIGFGSSIIKPMLNWQILLATVAFTCAISLVSALFVLRERKF